MIAAERRMHEFEQLSIEAKQEAVLALIDQGMNEYSAAAAAQLSVEAVRHMIGHRRAAAERGSR
jgi:hypothetical protein